MGQQTIKQFEVNKGLCQKGFDGLLSQSLVGPGFIWTWSWLDPLKNCLQSILTSPGLGLVLDLTVTFLIAALPQTLPLVPLIPYHVWSLIHIYHLHTVCNISEMYISVWWLDNEVSRTSLSKGLLWEFIAYISGCFK